EWLHAIEVGLYDVVTNLLRQSYKLTSDSWWYEGVPESLRKKAAELSEESKGKIPKEQGFFFVSYRQIIDENWKVFSLYFDPENRGKKDALGWIQELNDIRNR